MTRDQLKTAISEIAKPFTLITDSGMRLVVRTQEHLLYAPDGTVIVYPEVGGRHTLHPSQIASIEETIS